MSHEVSSELDIQTNPLMIAGSARDYLGAHPCLPSKVPLGVTLTWYLASTFQENNTETMWSIRSGFSL